MSRSRPTILPTPNFAWDPAARPPIADLRPYRLQTYRLEPEIGQRQIRRSQLWPWRRRHHAELGLRARDRRHCDCARRHGERQHCGARCGRDGPDRGQPACSRAISSVTVYAKEFPPHTTSNVAGGQWAPLMVNHRDSVQFTRILRRAFAEHKARGAAFGVSPRENYTLVHASNFESCPPDVIPRPTSFAHLPFAHLKSSGFGYATLLVEPPIFLAKMHDDLARGERRVCCASNFTISAKSPSLRRRLSSTAPGWDRRRSARTD